MSPIHQRTFGGSVHRITRRGHERVRRAQMTAIDELESRSLLDQLLAGCTEERARARLRCLSRQIVERLGATVETSTHFAALAGRASRADVQHAWRPELGPGKRDLVLKPTDDRAVPRQADTINHHDDDRDADGEA